MRHTRTFLILSILFLSVFFAQRLSAQVFNTSLDQNSVLAKMAAQNIKLLTTPENPQPLQAITVEAVSYSTDMNRAEFAWFVDGKVVLKGIGQKSLRLTTKKAGEKLSIVVNINTYEGVGVTKELLLAPAEVTLVWESLSYVPPFYKGKKLFPYMGKVRVTAVPFFPKGDGTYIPTDKLIFKWRKDSEVITEFSGYGKNYMEFEGAIIIRPADIDVEVTDVNKTMFAQARLPELTPIEAKVVLYEDNPTLGLLTNNAMGKSVVLSQKEATLRAVPYFFTTNKPNDYNLKYTWKMNGVNLGVEGDSITVRKEAGSGLSDISIGIENTRKILQFAKTAIKIDVAQ